MAIHSLSLKIKLRRSATQELTKLSNLNDAKHQGGVIAVRQIKKLDALVTDRVSDFADGNPGPAALPSRATSARCCSVGVEHSSVRVAVQEKQIPLLTYPKKYNGVTAEPPRY